MDGWVGAGAGNWLELESDPNVTSIVNDTWYHVMFVREGDTFYFYLNGALQNGAFNASIGDLDMVDATLLLAGGQGNDTSNFRGAVDEVIYFKRALSAMEIKSLYSRGVNTYPDSTQFVSRIMNGGSSLDLDDIEIQMQSPYGFNLPSSADPESGFASLNADANLLNGIVSLWHLDGTLGNNAGSQVDSEGANDGTPQRGAAGLTHENARLGTGIRFDGIDDTINLGNDASLQITGSHTIAAWIRYESLSVGSWPCVIAKDNEAISSGYGLYIASGFKVAHFFASGSYNDTISSPAIKPFEWTHIAVSHQAGQQIIYINGMAVGLQQGGSFAGNPANTAVNALMGHCGGSYFPGTIDEVVLWNRVATATEIRSLYARGAVTVQAQIKVCSLSDCSDGTFVGAGGTGASFFAIDYSDLSSAPAIFATPYSGQYLQYRLLLNTVDPTNTNVLPRINSVEFTYTP